MRQLYVPKLICVEAERCMVRERIPRPSGITWLTNPGDFKVYVGGLLVDVLPPAEFHQRYEAAPDAIATAQRRAA